MHLPTVGSAREYGDKMSLLWSDTHPDVERLMIERLRGMPAWRKVALMAGMTESVRTLHAEFTGNLTDPNVSDEAIRASLETLIAARARLERRTTEHVLLIRPLLSADQRERLIGLSQRGHRCLAD